MKTNNKNNTFLENGKWKFVGGMFNNDWYGEFAVAMRMAVENLKSKDKDWEFEHDKLTKIAGDELDEFYQEKTDIYLQREEMVADMWTAICSRTLYIDEYDNTFVTITDEDEWLTSLFPAEFLVWIAIAYEEILEIWKLEEKEKLDNKVKAQIAKLKIIRNESLSRIEHQDDDELF